MMWFGKFVVRVIACINILLIKELATETSCPEEAEEGVDATKEGVDATEENKRLLLHSEIDVATELLALRSELAELRGQLNNVTTQNNALLSEHVQLQGKVTNITAQNTALHTQQVELRGQLANITAQLNQVTGAKSQVVASSYVRWGRRECPDDSEFVYHGFTAGNHISIQGGGTDTICLASDPTWGNYDSSRNTAYRATLHGTELDIEVGSKIFAQNPNNQDLPCAVCRSPRPTSVMIPGRKDCYAGWTREYWGFLVTSLDHRPDGSNHICMDADPEYLQHGATNDNEHVLYLVEAICGSLPCPPYNDGREITCAVCSK